MSLKFESALLLAALSVALCVMPPLRAAPDRTGAAARPERKEKMPTALLPYDKTSPVFYDNDYANDYVDWFLMAVASAGDIQYRGISTSSSVAPFNHYLPLDFFQGCVRERTNIVQIGRRSGFRRIPAPVAGPLGCLVKPASGRIEETRPLDSPGTRALLAEAHKATTKTPLVVCMGGPLTLVADAYLLDPSIADKIVVAWTGGRYENMDDYNGWADPWAAYIALQKLRLVQFPIDPALYPRMTREWIRANLPDNEARKHMLALTLDVGNGGDGDGMPAVSMLRADYVTTVRRVAFGGWKTSDGHEVPTLTVDPNGPMIQVTGVSREAAEQEYQRAFTSPAAWKKPR